MKKISFDSDPSISSNYGGAQTWKVDAWDDGTTEPGSSGSPLYNQNNQIVGQLYGGDASCSYNFNDYYGKFSTTYNGSSTVQSQLGTTSDDTLNYYDPHEIIYQHDIQLLRIDSPNGSSCEPQHLEITVRNAGVEAITNVIVTYSYTINTEVILEGEWTTSWEQNLPSNQERTITIDNISIQNGQGTFAATATFTGDEYPDNNHKESDFNIGTGEIVTVTILTDNYPLETSWEIQDNAGDSVLSGGGLSDQNTTHTWSECLPPGDYTFTIHDSWEVIQYIQMI